MLYISISLILQDNELEDSVLKSIVKGWALGYNSYADAWYTHMHIAVFKFRFLW